MSIVEFQHVDIVFGERPLSALPLLDAGGSRDDILEQTGQVIGVADANLAVEEGEVCVLMGLSGSGKSTLLRAVNGLNRVTRGKVLVDAGETTVDVASCRPEVLRRLRRTRIAMVFQQFALLPWRTVGENVGLGLELRGMSRSERTRIVDQKLDLVGLAQWRDKYAHELSGGMQQRVGLARAFATDADILLMDEPFSALDPLIRTHLQDELLTLQRSLRKSIIFVSHDLDEALKLGTHIAIMEGGHIVQYGEPERIVLSPVNDYVRDFVAHMNPLNVLRGNSLMTPVDRLRRSDGEILLDRAGRFRMRLDDQGRPVGVRLDGREGRLVAYREGLVEEDADGIGMVTAPLDMSMRTAIELRQATGLPVALVEDGKLAGVCGDEEIYRGILRQSAMGDAVAVPPAESVTDPEG